MMNDGWPILVAFFATRVGAPCRKPRAAPFVSPARQRWVRNGRQRDESRRDGTPGCHKLLRLGPKRKKPKPRRPRRLPPPRSRRRREPHRNQFGYPRLLHG